MTQLLGIDVSHWNGRVNVLAFKAAGGGFVIAKVTDGTAYVDTEWAITRSDTHAAGLVFGGYHFAQWGDVTAEANHYLTVFKPQPGELLFLDAEAAIPTGVDVVAWTAKFSQIIFNATGAYPVVYMNSSWKNGHNWAAVVATDGLWLAKYDGVQTSVPADPWPVLAFKQYTATGTEPGVVGQVDVDTFYGDLPTLLKYAVPTSQGDPLSALTNAQQLELFANVADLRSWVRGGDPNHDNIFLIWDMLTKVLYRLVGTHTDGLDRLNDIYLAVKAIKPVDPQTIADTVTAAINALPDTEAAKVAELVVTALGTRLSAPPAA